MSKIEGTGMIKTTNFIAVGGVSSPAWWSSVKGWVATSLDGLPQLQDVSDVATLLVPILSAFWLFARIVVLVRGGVAQRYLKNDSGAVPVKASLGVASAVLAASVAFIGPWEGLELKAYPDALARNIPTVCYGETRGVKLGDSYTKAECDAMLAVAVAEFHVALTSCLPALSSMPEGVQVALTSWVYNVGPHAACKSTLVRKARAGDLLGACHQLPRWNRASGRVVRGLSNRRGAERALCLKSLS